MTDYAAELLDTPAGGMAPPPTALPASAPRQTTDYASELVGAADVQPPQQQEDEPGFFRGLYESTKESITGEKRRKGRDWEEVPVNVKAPTGEVIPIQDHMSIARDNNLARAEIFKNKLPEAQVYWDEDMIPYTDYFGKPRFLNTPGASMGDLSEAINVLPAEMAGAMGAGAVGKYIGKKLLIPGAAQVVGTGAGLGAISLGQDKIAEILGSTQGYDEKRAALMAAFGIGGEAAGLLLGRFFSRFAASQKMVDDSGKVTKKGRKVLEENNIDPEGVTPQFVKAWSALADDAVDPAHAVAVAEAGTLPHKVRMSKGDVTRDVEQQAFEIGAVKGSRGETAQRTMQGFREGQQDDLIANEQALQTIVGAADTPRVRAPGEGMAGAQERIAKSYKTARDAVRAAYDKAQEMGASVKAVDVQDLGRYMEGQLGSYNPATASKTFATVKGLMPQIGPVARPISVNIKKLESVRQQLSKLTRGADPVEAGAARRAISSYDKYMNALSERAMLLGDEATLEAYRRAGRLRAKVGDMFESDAMMSKLIEKQRKQLKVTPDEAMNMVFTASGLGAKRNAVRTLESMRRVLGKDSDEWADLREEAILRLFQSTRSRELRDDLTQAFSAPKFVSAMDDAFRRNRDLMNVLFNKREQGLLRQLRNVSARLIPRRGADNYSNTAAEVARILQGVFGGGAAITRDMLMSLSKKYRETRATRLVGEATDPIVTQRVPEPRLLPPGSLGGLTGLGAAQENRQRQNTGPMP